MICFFDIFSLMFIFTSAVICVCIYKKCATTEIATHKKYIAPIVATQFILYTKQVCGKEPVFLSKLKIQTCWCKNILNCVALILYHTLNGFSTLFFWYEKTFSVSVTIQFGKQSLNWEKAQKSHAVKVVLTFTLTLMAWLFVVSIKSLCKSKSNQ